MLAWKRPASKCATGGERGVQPGSPLVVWNDSPGSTDLLDALERHGVAVRVDGEALDPPVDLTAGLVRDLYYGLGLSAADIGLVTARSPGAVSRALRHHGVETRHHLPQPPGPQHAAGQLGRDTLVELVAEGGDAASIARSLGLPSPTTVRIAAQVLEVALPGDPGPRPIPRRVVQEVRRSGVSAAHAAAVLEPRHLGVGAARGLPPWPWPPGPSLLAYLYRALGIGLVECADRLRCDVDDLKEVFGSVGIDLRRPDAWQPQKRWSLDPKELRTLYLDEGHSVEAIAAHVGVSLSLVYKALHRHHLPVVPSGGRGEPGVRYDELLADARVRQALVEAGIAPVGADPPLRSTPLSHALLATLVGQLGLSTFDVELLTGRPMRAVREHCKNFAVQPPWLPPGVTAERLRELYEARGWSMSRICQELGLHSHEALRTALRRAGIPRRASRAGVETSSSRPRFGSA